MTTDLQGRTCIKAKECIKAALVSSTQLHVSFSVRYENNSIYEIRVSRNAEGTIVALTS